MRIDIDYFGDRRMSKKEEEINLLDLSQLTIEQRRELILKAVREGKEEAKLILMLSEWDRPGESFTDYARVEVLHGEVERVVMNHVYSYPTTNEFLYAFIPKTKTVILLRKTADDYEGELQEHETVYVFSYPQGWRSLDLY